MTQVSDLVDKYGLRFHPRTTEAEILEEIATAILKEDRKDRGLHTTSVIRGDEYSWFTPFQWRKIRKRESHVGPSAWHSWDGATITIAPKDSLRTHKRPVVMGRLDNRSEPERVQSVGLRATCDMSGCHKETYGKGLCVAHWNQHKRAAPPRCQFDQDNILCAGLRVCYAPDLDKWYCHRHWRRYKAHGDASVTKRAPNNKKELTKCSLPDCDRPHHAHGLCHTHTERLQRTGSVQWKGSSKIKWMKDTPCSVEGCDRASHAKLMCEMHYLRWKRKSDRELDK